MDASARPVLDRSARFLLAKFTPDLRRMEPRNIGLVGWSDGKVVARFLGENGEGPGKIHKLPKRLEPVETDIFEQWIGVWRHHIARGVIRAANGKIVSVNDPAFVDVLREQSKQSFRLVDSVSFLDHVPAGDLEEVLDDLFQELVETDEDRREAAAAESEAHKVKRRANAIFKETGITRRQDFHRDAPVAATVDDQFNAFTFDYVLGEGTPEAVFQRVAVFNQPSVTNAAYTLEWLGRGQRFQKTRRASLVELNGHSRDARARFALKELERNSQVIDLAASDAPAKIMALAGAPDA